VSPLNGTTKPNTDPSPTRPQSSPNTLEAPVPAVPLPQGRDRDSLDGHPEENGHVDVKHPNHDEDPDEEIDYEELDRLREIAEEMGLA